MDAVYAALQEAGLTDSEQRMYLALLENGEMSKTPLVRASKVSASKVYDVAARLTQKGLVSEIVRNKVKHFRAAPPTRVITYLEDRQKEIEEIKSQYEEIMPALSQLQNSQPEPYEVEVYKGWKGLRTVYELIFELLREGGTDYVIGASAGENPVVKDPLYDMLMQRFHDYKIPIKVIFNENAREGFENSTANTSNIEARFMPFTSPTEINIAKEYSFIITLSDEPIVISIQSKKTAEGFKEYFQTLWEFAK